ncbi:MAG: hypothetical protein J5616_03330 [Bacteroidaceae bacterium]|nr:hypothetical protein [Bacteroidaceae bacterium]
MGLKRLFKKGLLGGGNLIEGHIFDALQRKKETGKPFRQCLEESVKETIAEDFPGTSHVYEMGKNDGKKQGTIEQAERDEAKMLRIHEEHEREREKWREIDKEKDSLIDELGNGH